MSWRVFTPALMVCSIPAAQNKEKMQFPPVWDLYSPAKAHFLICDVNLTPPQPPPHFHPTSAFSFVCLFILLGCLKSREKAISMEIRPCEWQHRETETGTTGVNQNAVSDSAGLGPGLLWATEWLSDLGHDT